MGTINQKFATLFKRTAYSFGYQLLHVNDNTPKNVLLCVTPQRTGSTWLQDLVRCHPFAELWPNFALWDLLNLHGRRYPGDLSSTIDSKMMIETDPGNWERIPTFNVTQHIPAELKSVTNSFCAVEKIHPKFYNYINENFINSLNKARATYADLDIKLLYHVRDPKATIISYLNYNKRNPGWGGPSATDWQLLANRMIQNYRCVDELTTECPGIISDYTDLFESNEALLKLIFNFIWPKATKLQKELNDIVSQHAAETTKRGKRMQTGSLFFGENVGGVIADQSDEYEELFKQYNSEMDVCYMHYNNILKRKSLNSQYSEIG